MDFGCTEIQFPHFDTFSSVHKFLYVLNKSLSVDTQLTPEKSTWRWFVGLFLSINHVMILD